MTDLIDRQTAIDTLDKHLRTTDVPVSYPGIISALTEWLNELPSAQPEQTNSCYTNSWCIDCKEYDTENKCCPRYNRVIQQTLDDAYMHGETEAEARFHAQQRWIPCSERLPAYGEDVLISIGGYCNVGYIVSVNEEEQYNWYFSGWYHLPNDVDAWMPLPEPYEERRTYGN